VGRVVEWAKRLAWGGVVEGSGPATPQH
jgi:hypothetical protein